MTRNGKPPSTYLVSLCGLLSVLSNGCKQEPLCPELGDCGGLAPVGTWQLSPGHPSCSEDLYIPPTDLRLMGAEVPSARTPVIEPAVVDWCLQLVTNGGQKIQAKPPRFFYESGPIGWASVKYAPDGTYTLGLSRTGTFLLDFPALCMREFGAMDGRRAVDGQGMEVGEPTDICKQLQVPLAESGIGEGSYPNVLCQPNPDDPAGCLCQFDVTETGGGSGTYQMLDSQTIMHLPFSNFPQKATFCHQNGSLQLTGTDGNYLFGVRGLRTLDLTPAVDPCINGVKDPSETGVDCGGSCAAACMPPVVP